jgi:hypothetical protein
MDKKKVLESLPKASLGSTVREAVLQKIKNRIEKNAYNADPNLIKENRKTLKKIRNNLKKSHKTATLKNMAKRRFENVNRLLVAMGENSNSLSEGNISLNLSANENAQLAAPLEASFLAPPVAKDQEQVNRLSENIIQLDYSIAGRMENENKLKDPIEIVDNEEVNTKAQEDVRIRIEKAGFTNTDNETTAPKKIFIKTGSLANGDCLFSSIWHAAVERPEVASVFSGLLGLPMEDEREFIQEFRNILATNILSGVLPSANGKEDFYDRLKLFLTSSPESLELMKESYTDELRNVIEHFQQNPENKEFFLVNYAEFVAHQGNWMTDNEVQLMNQILKPFNLYVNTITDLRKIPSKLSEKVKGVNVLYVYNPDEKHYIYFSFTVPKEKEAEVRENLRVYLERVRDEKLRTIRSVRAGLVSEKQMKQARIQSLQRSRSKTPPRSKALPSHFLASLQSSPQSVKTAAPAPGPAPSTPLKLRPTKTSIVSGSPAGSVSSKLSKSRFDPETGEEWKGTEEQWIKRMEDLIDLAKLRKKSRGLF